MSGVCYGLCGDCLRVHKGTPEVIAALHSEEVLCECGGQVCACLSCAQYARLREAAAVVHQSAVVVQ